MLKIEKLSEKNLLQALEVIYPSAIITPQRRIKLLDRIVIVDYEVIYKDKRIYVEFDGPTHYTNSKTQLRDLDLKDYCDINNIKLIRLPYFIQIGPETIRTLFDHIEFPISHNLIESVYPNGFIDPKIIYPANYNHYGWKLFFEQYTKLIKIDEFAAMREIWHSLLDTHDPNLVIGIGWEEVETKNIFVNNYPT